MTPIAAARLRAYLTSTGRTARDVSVELGIAEETLSRWLCGKLVPSLMARIAIEHVTGISRADWSTY